MNKKFRKLILPASLLAALQANALGLGNLQVSSALDETLEGKILLVVDENDNIENIKVSIASSSEYERVGLDKSYVPSNIMVNMEGEGQNTYINISSKGPVSEPIVSLLLAVDWANGHLLREYTLLLDPSLVNSNQQEFSQQIQTQTYTAPVPLENTQKKSTQDAYTATGSTSSSYSQSSQVVVEAGETLWQIASRHSNGYISTQQMMVSIFNKNPSAFSNNDMNLLSKGAVLTIPDSDQAAMISNNEAIAEVKAHIQNWSRLQTQNDYSSNNSESSADYGIELVPPNDSDSENTRNSTDSDNKNLKADLNQAKEELANSLQENDELSNRVVELEKLVEDQESAMSLKDTNLAQLQQQLTNSDELVEVDASEATNNDDVWNDDEVTGENSETDIGSTIDDTTTEVEDDVVGDNSNLVDESVEVFENAEEINNTTSEIVENIKVEEPIVKKREISFFEKMLTYKTELISGLGILLLGLFGFLFMRRKGNDDSGNFLDSISEDNNTFIADSNDESIELTKLDDVDEINLSEPEVVIMDEVEEELSDELEDFSIDDFDSDAVTELDNKTLDLEVLDLENDLSNDNDLSIDIDLDEANSEEKVVSNRIEDGLEEINSELDLEESLDMDFDLDADLIDLNEVVETNSQLENLEFDAEEKGEITVDDLNLDLEELDLEELDLDELDEINDLTIDDNEDLSLDLISEVEGTDNTPVDIGLDFDDIVDDAIDTKLDLAKAYFEMGDIDGANQMVEEIIEEGNDSQKDKAEELLIEIKG